MDPRNIVATVGAPARSERSVPLKALVSQINAAWILQAVLTSTFSDPVALPRNEPNQG